MAFLSVRNIVKHFDTHTALKNVSIDIEKGELVSILGPSGCGKTTLLRIIAGLETADEGQVIIDGRDCASLPPSKRNFGIVFQSYALFPHMTVEQNILFGLNQQKNLSKEERKNRCQEVLEMVDLYDQRKIPLRCPADSSREWRLPERYLSNLLFCCWTNPFQRWMPRCG